MASRYSLPPMSPAKDPFGHPLFQGGISRWLWRVYTQRLTPAGRWLLIITGIFTVYGGASLQLQGYVVATYAVALWTIALVGLVLFRPKVRLHVRLADRVSVGETLPVDLEVTQLSRVRGADLVALPHRLPMSIDCVPPDGIALPDLRQGEPARVRLGLRCSQRGGYTLQGFRVESGFPFGIVRSRRTFREPRKLMVYPKFTPLSHLRLPTGRRYQPGGVALASDIGDSFEYLGNREYREGDNVRDIDWRATARVGHQRPIVREWVEEYMLRVAVILDTQVPKNANRPTTDSFERAVSIAAAVSDYMARQDYLVDLFAAGPNLYHLTAGRSLAYLDQILDILACVESNPAEPFDVIEPQIAEMLSRISTVICVFLDFNETRRAFVERVQAQGAAVKVVIVRDSKPALDPSDAAEFGDVPIIDKQQFDRGVQDL